MGQIWSQIENLVFLEIWDVPWLISMATIRRGTFMFCPPVFIGTINDEDCDLQGPSSVAGWLAGHRFEPL